MRQLETNAAFRRGITSEWRRILARFLLLIPIRMENNTETAKNCAYFRLYLALIRYGSFPLFEMRAEAEEREHSAENPRPKKNN